MNFKMMAGIYIAAAVAFVTQWAAVSCTKSRVSDFDVTF